MSHKPSVSAIPTKKAAIILFSVIAVVWLAIDRISKVIVDSAYVGDVIVPHVLGLFEFRLAHNTGAAWSVLSNSTMALGVFSLIVCAVMLFYLFIFRKCQANYLEFVGLALVFAGGLGNAYDRFAYGYVVDFIRTTFIDFPIFNIADIGVTCGIVLFFLGYYLLVRSLENESKQDGE